MAQLWRLSILRSSCRMLMRFDLERYEPKVGLDEHCQWRRGDRPLSGLEGLVNVDVVGSV